MASYVLVVEEDLKHLLLQTQKYQYDIVDLTKLYETANDQNMQHMDELKGMRTALSEAYAQTKQLQEENASYRELMKARDQQVTILQQYIVKLAQSNADLDVNSLVGLISPTEGANLNEYLQLIRYALNAKAGDGKSVLESSNLKNQLESVQRYLEEVTMEYNKLRFETQDYKLPDSVVVRQLEARIYDQNYKLSEMKIYSVESQQKIASLEQLYPYIEQLTTQLYLRQQEVTEKEADILYLIYEFYKLQEDNYELQQALDKGVNFEVKSDLMRVDYLSYTDLTAENAVLEFQTDFESMLEELYGDVVYTTQKLEQVCQMLSSNWNVVVNSANMIPQLQLLISEFYNLRSGALSLQPNGHYMGEQYAGNDAYIMALKDENELNYKQICALKTELAQRTEELARREHEIADFKAEIVALNQQITSRDVTVHSQNDKLREQEQILAQARDKLGHFYQTAEQLEQTYLVSSDNEKVALQLKQENATYKQLLSNATDYMNAKTQEIYGLTTKIAYLMQENQGLEERITNLENKMQEEKIKYQTAYSDANEKVYAAVIENKHLVQQKNEIQVLCDSLSKENQYLKTMALRTENSIYEQQNLLNQTTTASVSFQYVNDELKQQNKQLQIQIERLRNDKEELLLKMSDIKLLKNYLENDLKLAQEQAKQAGIQLYNENQILYTYNNDFKTILNYKNAEINELEIALRKAYAEVKEAAFDLKKEQETQKATETDLQRQLQESNKKIVTQTEALYLVYQQISQFSDSIALKEAAISQYQNQIALLYEQLIKAENNAKNLQIELERANNEKHRMQQDLQYTELEINQREENFLEQTQLIKTKYEDFTQKQLDREIYKREAEIMRLKESLEKCQAELSMGYIELERAKNQIKMSQNDIETLNVKIAQEEQLTYRIRQNAGELKRQQEEKIAALQRELQTVAQKASYREMQAKLEEAQRTASVRDDYTAQLNSLVQQIKDLQLENEKMKIQKQMEAVERGKLNYDVEVLKQKLVDTEAGYNYQVKQAQKYKDLYKKAYDVVDKLKTKESESKRVIGELEDRVKAIESRKAGEPKQLRQRWGDNAW